MYLLLFLLTTLPPNLCDDVDRELQWAVKAELITEYQRSQIFLRCVEAFE